MIKERERDREIFFCPNLPFHLRDQHVFDITVISRRIGRTHGGRAEVSECLFGYIGVKDVEATDIKYDVSHWALTQVFAEKRRNHADF